MAEALRELSSTRTLETVSAVFPANDNGTEQARNNEIFALVPAKM
jgi:hypothetical protein